MRPSQFDPEKDLPPMPFDERCRFLAAELKEAGLAWIPHVGCFVWDREDNIETPSPFPDNVYFILNLNRFIEIFETIEKAGKQLVWLPTWHQARLLCRRYGIDKTCMLRNMGHEALMCEGEDLLALYGLLLGKLGNM